VRITISDRDSVVFAAHDLDADAWKQLADLLRDAMLTHDLGAPAEAAVEDLIAAARKGREEGR